MSKASGVLLKNRSCLPAASTWDLHGVSWSPCYTCFKLLLMCIIFCSSWSSVLCPECPILHVSLYCRFVYCHFGFFYRLFNKIIWKCISWLHHRNVYIKFSDHIVFLVSGRLKSQKFGKLNNLKLLVARTPMNLNRIANIGKGHICLRDTIICETVN